MAENVYNSTLFVPAVGVVAGVIEWVETFPIQHDDGTLEMVEVMVFNVAKKRDILPLLEEVHRSLEWFENPDEYQVHQMAYIEQSIRLLSGGEFNRTIHPALLTQCRKFFGDSFDPSNAFYHSGDGQTVLDNYRKDKFDNKKVVYPSGECDTTSNEVDVTCV